MTGYQLVVLEGKDAGQVHLLDRPLLTLGRPGSGVEGAIEFEEPSVSRVHAVLEWVEDSQAYHLSNRSFTNPARVDGEPARGSMPLAPGSRIQLGGLVAEIQFAAAGQADDEAPLRGFLELVRQGAADHRFLVYGRTMTIGRSDVCDIWLDSQAVSRHHAQLEWYGDVPVLVGLTDLDATRVNGQRIPKGAALTDQDEILLGGEVRLRWIALVTLDEEVEAQRKAAVSGKVQEESQAARPSELRLPLGLWLRDMFVGASPGDRAAFYRGLQECLARGDSMALAVEESARQALPRFAPFLAQDVRNGLGLADACAAFPGTFSFYEDSMARAGEEAGILETQLGLVVEALEDSTALRSALLDRLRFTLVLLALLLPVAMLPFLGFRGAGEYAGAVARAGLSWVVLAIGMALGFRLVDHSVGLRQRLEDFLAGRSRMGPALQLLAASRFLRTMGPLLASGLQVQRAALLAARCTGSVRYGTRLVEAAEDLARGVPVREALGRTGVLSEEILEEIGQAEEAGNLPELLASVSVPLEEEARACMASILPYAAAMLTFLALLLALGSVGWVYLACF